MYEGVPDHGLPNKAMHTKHIRYLTCVCLLVSLLSHRNFIGKSGLYAVTGEFVWNLFS